MYQSNHVLKVRVFTSIMVEHVDVRICMLDFGSQYFYLNRMFTSRTKYQNLNIMSCCYWNVALPNGETPLLAAAVNDHFKSKWWLF